ncbi:hypothetical protein pb186bvf_002857 [Paramecium bursaria]
MDYIIDLFLLIQIGGELDRSAQMHRIYSYLIIQFYSNLLRQYHNINLELRISRF